VCALNILLCSLVELKRKKELKLEGFDWLGNLHYSLTTGRLSLLLRDDETRGPPFEESGERQLATSEQGGPIEVAPPHRGIGYRSESTFEVLTFTLTKFT